MNTNDSIISYVPIASRVQAKTKHSQAICQNFFTLIDKVISAQICFNHETSKGLLSISPDQINDLLNELSKNDSSMKDIDIHKLKNSLADLVYPIFNGEQTLISPIWNKTEVRVWQFQLDQIANEVDSKVTQSEAEHQLDLALSSIRIWRQSIESSRHNSEVIYSVVDLGYKLLDIELKLQNVQHFIDQ